MGRLLGVLGPRLPVPKRLPHKPRFRLAIVLELYKDPGRASQQERRDVRPAVRPTRPRAALKPNGRALRANHPALSSISRGKD
jgi:hypothetical protein